MSLLTPHRQGDFWKGHLWIYRDPQTGEPYDLTGHRSSGALKQTVRGQSYELLVFFSTT